MTSSYSNPRRNYSIQVFKDATLKLINMSQKKRNKHSFVKCNTSAIRALK